MQGRVARRGMKVHEHAQGCCEGCRWLSRVPPSHPATLWYGGPPNQQHPSSRRHPPNQHPPVAFSSNTLVCNDTLLPPTTNVSICSSKKVAQDPGFSFQGVNVSPVRREDSTRRQQQAVHGAPTTTPAPSTGCKPSRQANPAAHKDHRFMVWGWWHHPRSTATHQPHTHPTNSHPRHPPLPHQCLPSQSRSRRA